MRDGKTILTHYIMVDSSTVICWIVVVVALLFYFMVNI